VGGEGGVGRAWKGKEAGGKARDGKKRGEGKEKGMKSVPANKNLRLYPWL